MNDAEDAARAARFIRRFGTDYEAAIRELISAVDDEPDEAAVLVVEEAAARNVANTILRAQAEHGLRTGLTQATLALVTLGDLHERCQFMNALQRRWIAAMGVLATARAITDSLNQGAN